MEVVPENEPLEAHNFVTKSDSDSIKQEVDAPANEPLDVHNFVTKSSSDSVKQEEDEPANEPLDVHNFVTKSSSDSVKQEEDEPLEVHNFVTKSSSDSVKQEEDAPANEEKENNLPPETLEKSNIKNTPNFESDAPEDAPRILGNLNSENFQKNCEDAASPKGTPSKYSLSTQPRKSNSSVSPNIASQLTRSMTMRPSKEDEKFTSNDFSPRLKRRSLTSLQVMTPQQADRLKIAKVVAENAIKPNRLETAKATAEEALQQNKIFTIIGPYKKVRLALRERGWVEKFYKLQGGVQAVTKKSTSTVKNTNDDDYLDDDDDDDDADYDDDDPIPPWEEEDGLYGIMSRIVRNAEPYFIWSLRKGQVDFRFLKKDQIVNHHAKASIFTTKVGLCKILRELHWYEDSHCDLFFPRCYILTLDDEKAAFIEDFRRCACMALIKIIVSGENTVKEKEPEELEIIKEAQIQSDRSTDGSRKKSRKVICVQPKIQYFSRRVPGTKVPQMAIDFALDRCKAILVDKYHENLDKISELLVSDAEWERFLQWYYMVVHDGAEIEGGESRLMDCQKVHDQLKEYYPQYDMDGIRNVWILKPGAKSRGRGIQCYNRLDDMLKLVNSTTVPQGEYKYIVQKYIERPLLIFNTKFDIRQWFLVTDWNPLTVWMYKKCYVRFCSQQFTLEDFNEAVHLSNNSIQYKYENGPRSPFLPAENMWDLSDLKSWLRKNGPHDIWESTICPGMKSAIISSLLCSQDYIEVRRNCFELFGADFMISDNFLPYLIEINSSPTLAQSTEVTARLTSNVIDDTMKVVLDRRQDRHCSVGDYELIYKQNAVSVPIYSGLDLTISGTHVKKPSSMTNTQSQTRPSIVKVDTSSPINNDEDSDNNDESSLANNSPPRKQRRVSRIIDSFTVEKSAEMKKREAILQRQRYLRDLEKHVKKINASFTPRDFIHSDSLKSSHSSSASFVKAGPPRVYEVARAKQQERDQKEEAFFQNSLKKERRLSETSHKKAPRCYEVAREKQKEMAHQHTKEPPNKENFTPPVMSYSHGNKNPISNKAAMNVTTSLDSPNDTDSEQNGAMKGSVKIKEKKPFYPGLLRGTQEKLSVNYNCNPNSMNGLLSSEMYDNTTSDENSDFDFKLVNKNSQVKRLQLPVVKTYSKKRAVKYKSFTETIHNMFEESIYKIEKDLDETPAAPTSDFIQRNKRQGSSSNSAMFPMLNTCKWRNSATSKPQKESFKMTTILLNEQHSSKSFYL